MREIEYGNQFTTRIKGNNSVLIWRTLSIFNLKPLLLNINSHAKFEGNRQKKREIEHWNQFPTRFKSNNSVLIWRNLSIYNPEPLLLNINSYTKFEDNRPKNERKRARTRYAICVSIGVLNIYSGKEMRLVTAMSVPAKRVNYQVHVWLLAFTWNNPTLPGADPDGETDRGSGPLLKNHKNIGFLSNSDPDPLKNHKATEPAFNVGPSSARQRNAI